LTFSPEDRAENIRRIGEMTKLFVDAGIIALTAFISPYQKDRQKLRSLFSNGEFLEIYVECPPEVCAERDKKGIYAKAKAGSLLQTRRKGGYKTCTTSYQTTRHSAFPLSGNQFTGR